MTTGQVILRPMVNVEVATGPKERATTKALIDTGAPRTVFPRGIGDLIGVPFLDGPGGTGVLIDLMGRRWAAVTQTVDLLLRPFDDLGWTAEVDFVVDEGLPFALLGYEGFLNRWAVSFNAYKGYVVVEPIESFDERLPLDPFVEAQERWPDSYRP
ncbi:MAG: hypothetical protein QOF60_2913 [Actinomycetota bacterium]|jgi:hypothetical protein|nr:hypothetical protein [Actinomycetota bacterium]